ncbi:hypothetical protein ACQY0O_005691 [Thecaphora frezii]
MGSTLFSSTISHFPAASCHSILLQSEESLPRRETTDLTFRPLEGHPAEIEPKSTQPLSASSKIHTPATTLCSAWTPSDVGGIEHETRSLSLSNSLPSLSEGSLSPASSSQHPSPFNSEQSQWHHPDAPRLPIDTAIAPLSAPASTQSHQPLDTMSNASDSPVQPGYREGDSLNRWNQDRRDSAPVSGSQYMYESSFSGSDTASKGMPPFSAGFSSARDSFSGSNSLSPSAHPASHPTSNGSLPPPQQPGLGLPPALQDSYMLHRASISGPVMGPSPSYQGEAETMAAPAPAPPRAHGLAAWETASGAARPHTADGMFGHFGFPNANAASSESGGAGDGAPPMQGGGMGAPRSFASASNPMMAYDAYSQQRRFSTPAVPVASEMGGNKIFSYMPPMDDGLPGSGGPSYGANAYAGHMLGGIGGFGIGVGKKRPRRRYDEIERLYPCKWPGCTKSYGTLNHLNAHVAMQKHGPKRSPTEFKDMRKAWRRQKKEEEQRRQARQTANSDHALNRAPMMSSGGYLGGPSASSSLPPALANGLSPVSVLPPMGPGGHAPLSGPTSMAAPPARYSMSSISSSPGSAPLYGYGHPASSNLAALGPSSSGFDPMSSGSGGSESRPYTAGGSNQAGAGPYPPGGLGAYLMAHRGSI